MFESVIGYYYGILNIINLYTVFNDQRWKNSLFIIKI